MGPSSTATHVGRTTTRGTGQPGLPRGPSRYIGAQRDNVAPGYVSAGTTTRTGIVPPKLPGCQAPPGRSRLRVRVRGIADHVYQSRWNDGHPNGAVAGSVMRSATIADAVAWRGSAAAARDCPSFRWVAFSPALPPPAEAEPGLPPVDSKETRSNPSHCGRARCPSSTWSRWSCGHLLCARTLESSDDASGAREHSTGGRHDLLVVASRPGGEVSGRV